MYPLDWVSKRKLGTIGQPAAGELARVSPVVWALGLTSFLTDISSEMVHSVLPVYLVLHLHLSPLQYGAIDGVYNGLAVVMVSLAAGVIADRARRHKQVALTGTDFQRSASCCCSPPEARGGASSPPSASIGWARGSERRLAMR